MTTVGPVTGQKIYLPDFQTVDPVVGKRYGGQATVMNVWKSAPNTHWVATHEHSPHNLIPWEELLLPIQDELKAKYQDTVAYSKF